MAPQKERGVRDVSRNVDAHGHTVWSSLAGTGPMAWAACVFGVARQGGQFLILDQVQLFRVEESGAVGELGEHRPLAVVSRVQINASKVSLPAAIVPTQGLFRVPYLI